MEEIHMWENTEGWQGSMEGWVQWTERQKEYVQMKRCPENESFADRSAGASIRLMMRGGCLPVRGSERMAWKYDETKEHMLFECNRYGEERGRRRGVKK